MNIVSPQTPVAEVSALLERDGYALMENALSAEQLASVQAAYESVLAQHAATPGQNRIEIPRILELDSRFEVLMDNAPVFNVARDVLGYDIELASGGELDHKLPKTGAHIGWHNDFVWMRNIPYPRQNFWVRATYFISDVTAEMGPFTLLPGSHRATQGCPDAWDEAGRPAELPGMLRITGRAGSCLLNNTEIWHTNTPNESDAPRPLIFVLYKHAWMKQWQDGYEMSPAFAARQTDPVRQQLCGAVAWHNGAEHFPARANA